MSSRLRYGAPWLKSVLPRCAWAATRNKHNYLYAQFVRLRARRGRQKAIITVAALDPFHRLLCAAQPSALSRSRIALFHPAHLSSDDLSEDRLDRWRMTNISSHEGSSFASLRNARK